MQSQDDRDREGFAARRERDRDGTVKEFKNEEITGRYEGEELAARRAERSRGEGFSKLEQKHDELKKDVEKKHDELTRDIREVRTEFGSDIKKLSGQVSDVRADVAGVGGKLEGHEKLLSETLSIVRKTADRNAERAHVTLTAELDVDRAQKLAKVEVEKEVQLDTIDAQRSERDDTSDKKKKRRDAFLTGLAFITSGGGLVELLHKLGVL